MNIKILIIDDEIKLEEIYKTFLSKINAEVVFCDHPQKAWKAIEKEKFDLIISDLKMPVIEGDEFVKIVRNSKLNNLAPIILCSGHMDKKVLSELTRSSKIYFLNKPFDSKSLLELVLKTQDKVNAEVTGLNLEITQSLTLELKEAMFCSKISEFEKNRIWNFDSVLINFSILKQNELIFINLIMQVKTYLSIAGKIQGTMYTEIENETFDIWKHQLQKKLGISSKVNFVKIRGMEILDSANESTVIKSLQNDYDEIIAIIK